MSNLPTCTINKFGTKEWHLNGKLHRENGPAVEDAMGNKEWFFNGEFHCETGPAIDLVDGTKMWYRKGLLHRETGPAYVDADGTLEWWLADRQFHSIADFCDALKMTPEEKTIFLLKWA